MTTAETLARFQHEYQVPRSITEQRADHQMRLLIRFADQLGKPLLELAQQDVLTFLGADLTRGLSPNTVRKHYMMLRSFVTWAHAAALMDDEQVRLIKLIAKPRGSSSQATPNPYTIAEIRRFKLVLSAKYPALPEYGRGSRLLRRYLNGKGSKGKPPALRRELWRHTRRLQFEAQIALALEMGLRCKEIHTLTIHAAHYENDAVVVTTAKTGPGVAKLRTVPWTPHAHSCMTEWLDFRHNLVPPNDSLWLALGYQSAGADQLAAQALQQIHYSLSVFEGDWHWHRLRHTAATEWLRAGMPLDKLQVLMGHARPEQTQAYTQILKGDIMDAMAASGEAFATRLGLAA